MSASTPASSRAPRRPLPVGFWPVWSTVALDLIGFGIVVPILGVYAERYGANGFTVGMLFAVYSAAQFLAAPLLGRLSDRVGRRPVIVISLLGTAAGSFLTGAAGSLPLLFAGRIVDGASGGSLAVGQAAVADLAEPQDRARLMGLLGAAFGVGFVIGPAIGGLASLGGPHVPFYVAGVLALVNAVAAWVRVPETLERGQRQQPVADQSARRALTPALGRLAAVGFVTTLAFAAFEATFALFGKRRFGLTEGGVSVVFLCIGVVLVAIQGGLYARLSQRTTTLRVYLAGLAVLAVGLAVTGSAAVWPVLIVALLLVTAGQGLVSPAITELVSVFAPPRQRGQAMGFQQSAYSVGRIIGPPLAGLLFDHVAIWMPFAAAAVAVAAVWLPASRVERAGSTT